MQDNEYLETQVMTAPPHQLHLMVLDGAIRFATRAEHALDQGDPETGHLALTKSRAFVTELLSGLDRERAPEMVDQLQSLFLFVYRNLVEADLQRDPQRVRNALRILRIHRETWIALMEKLQRDQEAIGAPHFDSGDDGQSRSWTG